jgi:acylphosphatase
VARQAFLITITGRVQGVGFRAFIRRTAEQFGLEGWVRNRLDGSVEIMVIGDPDVIDRLIDASNAGPPLAKPEEISLRGAEDDGTTGFLEKPTA